MQLVCPKCESSYAVADNALGDSGRTVRCVRCKHVWFAKLPEPALAEAAVQAADIEQLSADVQNVAMSEPPSSPDAATGDAAWPAAEEAVPPHIDDAPPVVPDQPEESPTADGKGAKAKPDYLELRRRKEVFKKAARTRGWEIVTTARISAALIGVLVALVYERENIARVMPQTASFYALLGFHINLRGLSFEGFKTSAEMQDGVPVLVIEGEIRNVTNVIQQVPNLRFALRNTAGAEVYGWTGVPERNLMVPGDVQKVHTRLASPPAEGRDARVRFMHPRDMLAAAAKR